MTIKKTPSGWLVDVQPGGRGFKRFRKTFPTKAEALAYDAWIKTKVSQSPEWEPAKRDTRRLSDLIKTWYEQHGVNLRAGKNTFSRLNHMCIAMGNPVADRFNAELFSEYRSKRLKEGISANCLNREQAYLRAVFNELRNCPLIISRSMHASRLPPRKAGGLGWGWGECGTAFGRFNAKLSEWHRLPCVRLVANHESVATNDPRPKVTRNKKSTINIETAVR